MHAADSSSNTSEPSQPASRQPLVTLQRWVLLITGLVFLINLGVSVTVILSVQELSSTAQSLVPGSSIDVQLLHKLDLLKNIIDQTYTHAQTLLILLAASGLTMLLLIPWMWRQSKISNRLASLNQQVQHLLDYNRPADEPPPVTSEACDVIAELEHKLAGLVTQHQQFQSQSTQLQNVENELEEATRIKAEFLANVGHELRTPLSAVIGYIEVVTRTSDAQHRIILNKAKSAANGLLDTLNNILDVAKFDAGKIKLEQERFSLHSLLNDLVNVTAIMAEKKHLQLLIDAPPTLPSLLIGDSLRLKQILMNLLSNAIKFTERGEVILSIHANRITDQELELTFAVKDTGIGVPESKRSQLFQSFTQLDGQSTRQYGGTGLGLHICQRLCHLMGGHIECTSAPHNGSVFSFTLNFKRASSSEVPRPHINSDKVLVILSHSQSEQKILEKHLSLYYKQILTYERLEQLQNDIGTTLCATPQAIDCLINIESLYVKANGAQQLLQALRSTHVHTSIVVMIGHMDQQVHLERLKAWSVNKYITRPAHIEQIIEAFNDRDDTLDHRSRATADSNSLRNMHILLAEDTEALREITAESLMAFGATVDRVSNGSEAIAAVLNPMNSYDLILMDLQMPFVDGIQATRRIRELYDPKTLPIVALTSHTLEHVKQRCTEVGMNHHLSKPVNIKHLLDWIFMMSIQQGTAVAPNTSLINLNDALARFCFKNDLLMNAISRFVKEYSDNDALFSDLATHPKRAAALGHRLRGVACTISADALEQKAIEL